MSDGTSSPGCSCFWFMTNRSIYGISIDNLKRLGNDGVSDKNRLRDLSSLPPFPSDFAIDHLPEMFMNPLIHDCKLFLFCDWITDLNCHPSSKIYQLSFLDNNILRLSEAPPSSVPPLPVTIGGFHSFGNIGAEFYLIQSRSQSSLFGNQEHVEEGFWVLDGARKEWRTLKHPLAIIDKTLEPNMFFFFKDKIFSDATIIRPSIGHHVSVYNRGTGDWEKANYREYEKLKELALQSTVVSLPHQKSVAVSWGFCTDDQGLALCRMTFSASMLNLQDFSLSRCQSLDELCTLGLFRDHYHPLPEVKIVDLDGKGLVCALVQGMIDAYDDLGNSTVLCVFVFALSLADDDDDPSKKDDEEHKRFLDVDVLVNRVFTLPEHVEGIDGIKTLDYLHRAFVFPSTMEEQLPH